RPGGTLTLYVDGVQVASASVRTGQAMASSAPLLIGGLTEKWTWQPPGAPIDEVKILSTGRTAAGVGSELTHMPASHAAGVVLYLPMNDASGSATLAGAGPGAVGATVTSANGGLAGLVTGHIDNPGQVDTYTFNLAAPTLIQLDTLSDNDQITLTFRGPQGQ